VSLKLKQPVSGIGLYGSGIGSCDTIDLNANWSVINPNIKNVRILFLLNLDAKHKKNKKLNSNEKENTV
jgi:hypothetical protein